MVALSLLAALSLVAGRPDSTRTARPSTSHRSVAVAPGSVDSILVEKGLRRLTMFAHGRAVRVYEVALGDPDGDKLRAGDEKTPEGRFRIDWRVPKSRYPIALHVSYPDAAHRARAQKLGVSPGGDIMIHGLPNGMGFVGAAHRADDWTNGCIAVTNEEIEEISRLVRIGALIEIRP
jgi:murein L,D-transpeptidase YafK